MRKECNNRGSFLTEADAIDEVNRVSTKYGGAYSYYKCSMCGMYHIRGSEYDVKSSYECGCRDTFGRPKKLYPTYNDAKKALDNSECGTLEIYKCRKGKGYHLTSHHRF